MLLKEVLEEFIYEMEYRNYSPRTIKGYRNNNLAFFKFVSADFGVERLEQVKRLHIKAYFMHLKKIGRKATYINGILKNIRSFFKYCMEEEYITRQDNPALTVNWLKEDKPVIDTFNDAEVSAMIQHYKPTSWMQMRNRLIIMLLADTGIRASELINIQHVDILKFSIKITGKGRKERYVPISPILKKNIIKYERMTMEYFKDKPLTNDYYFLSYRCNPLTLEALERVVRLAGERTGVRKHIRCSPHTLRHYYAQKMLQSGTDVYSLSRLLGHNTINVTKTYLQSLQDDEITEKGRENSPLMNLKK